MPARTSPYTFSKAAYAHQLRQLVGAALAEDIGTGDRTTTALRLHGIRGRARLISRNDGVLAGVDAADQPIVSGGDIRESLVTEIA